MRAFILVVSIFWPIQLVANGPLRDGSVSHTEKIRHYVNLYLSTEKDQHCNADALFAFTRKLEEKKSSFKYQKGFLHYLFTKTHHRFLKHYTDYASFSELLDNGTYNCLTGTALYALLLDHFEFKYQIIETNYHIFLLAETDQGKILFEATDPIGGFCDDSAEIENRVSSYKRNTVQTASSSKTYYHYNVELYNQVSLDQMLGLLYYNLAIVAYNNHELTSVVEHLEQAVGLYQSPRLEEFSGIVLLTLLESNLKRAEKEINVKKIQIIRSKIVSSMAVVSR